MTTKRSQAAMNFKAGFKLITTGTPIENHLGELWNLFRFINPGLLGSFESFNQRFAVPIEKYQDKQARSKLKKLIQPFLLRRTKNEVEDQASDRAHRIGQQRPVTIYRLVAKDTIEDKIVDLHHHKHDLADSLLEGADVSGKISTEALLQLISEN